MVALIERVLDSIPHDTFTDTELWAIVPGTPSSRYNAVKRAIAKQQLIPIRKGLYSLAKRYQKHGISTFALANQIYGPSYVSFESALSHHGLIPEATYTVTNASLVRKKLFDTPLGVFSYTPVSKRTFMVGVERIEQGRDSFFMASPLKALVDYVYVHKLNWTCMEPLRESLRIVKIDSSTSIRSAPVA